MTETGWPLIPREVLPAPIPAAKTRIGGRLPGPPGDVGRQLSIFGAETTEPSPADLAGLLAGPGRLGRMGGTARVTVPVDAAWRVHVLVAELVSRGLVVNWHPTEDVRDVVHPVAPERRDSSEVPAPPVARSSVAATFDPDADPTPDLPSDVDFLPTDESGKSLPESPRDSPADARGARTVGGRGAATVDGRGAATVDGRGAATVDDSGAATVDGSGAATVDGSGAETIEGPGEEGGDDTEPPESAPAPRFEVVTAYSSRLTGLARAWPDAAAQLFLSGPRLRLWVAAAGEPVPGGYALGLDPASESPDELRAVDAALVRAGLAGRVSPDGRHYVIAGRRRLKRLAELVGERPAAAPPELWPDGAAA